MTDSLDQFLQNLRFDLPAGLVERAMQSVTGNEQSTLDHSVERVSPETEGRGQPEIQAAPPLRKTEARREIHSRERQRQPKVLALVAALLALLIVATLVLTTRSLHPRQVVPAHPVVPANPIPLPKSGALGPGTYSFLNPAPGSLCTSDCSAYRWIYFTLPAGWATSNGLIYKHLNQPGEVAFSFWTVDQVYADPCHWQTSALSPLDIRNTSYDPATGAYVVTPHAGGLANQSLRGPLPRALAPVTFKFVDASGASWPTDAFRIDLSVPTGLDISTCDMGQFRSWTAAHVADNPGYPFGGANSHNAPGQLDSVYMLDVDRWPLVIDASNMPGTSAADLAELQAIVASMIIDRG